MNISAKGTMDKFTYWFKVCSFLYPNTGGRTCCITFTICLNPSPAIQKVQCFLPEAMRHNLQSGTFLHCFVFTWVVSHAGFCTFLVARRSWQKTDSKFNSPSAEKKPFSLSLLYVHPAGLIITRDHSSSLNCFNLELENTRCEVGIRHDCKEIHN